MKLTCIFFVLIGASFAMAQNTTAAPTTTVEFTTANLTTANFTTANFTTAIATTTANTTTAAPTTTIVMTTTPMPQETTWSLNNSDNVTCILEQMQADFSINYMMINAENKTVQSMISFRLPQLATVDTENSTCGSNGTMPKLTLVFDDPANGNKFEQVFTMSANNSALTNITLALRHTDAIFPNSTHSGELVMYSATLPSTTFMVNNGQCYLCNSLQKFKIDDNANVTFSRVRVQTADIVDNKFGNESQCPQDTPSTSPATTSSMAPSTTQYPPAEQWVIRNEDNQICMIFNMSLEFSITYETSKGKKNTTVVKLPKTADSSNSSCDPNTTSIFVLTFGGWTLEMDFTLNTTAMKYNNTMTKLTYPFDDPNFVNPKKNGTATASTGKSGISATAGDYYSCVNKVELSADNVTFIFHDVKIQPFALESNGTLGNASPCPADDKFNNIVPIAVGCALAGLVIIVLIAYLIGRQRSSKSGYESV